MRRYNKFFVLLLLSLKSCLTHLDIFSCTVCSPSVFPDKLNQLPEKSILILIMCAGFSKIIESQVHKC